MIHGGVSKGLPKGLRSAACIRFAAATDASIICDQRLVSGGKHLTHMPTAIRRVFTVLLWIFVPVAAFAQEPFGINPTTMTNTGVSGIWILANISYAGMRAQGSNQAGWRIVAFIFGLPGTLLTFLVVSDSGGSAYGIQLPTVDDEDDSD
jgi:hypothetical protein